MGKLKIYNHKVSLPDLNKPMSSSTDMLKPMSGMYLNKRYANEPFGTGPPTPAEMLYGNSVKSQADTAPNF